MEVGSDFKQWELISCSWVTTCVASLAPKRDWQKDTTYNMHVHRWIYIAICNKDTSSRSSVAFFLRANISCSYSCSQLNIMFENIFNLFEGFDEHIYTCKELVAPWFSFPAHPVILLLSWLLASLCLHRLSQNNWMSERVNYSFLSPSYTQQFSNLPNLQVSTAMEPWLEVKMPGMVNGWCQDSAICCGFNHFHWFWSQITKKASAIQRNHVKVGENGNPWIPWKIRKKYGYMYGKTRPFYAKARPLYVYGWGTYKINVLHVFCAYLVRILLSR